MVNTQTLRADASMLAQDVMGSSWHGIINRLRDAADEIDRLRASRAALREALGEAVDAMEAHDWGERDGDCTILFASEIDNLRVALAAVPAPDAEDAHDRSREAMNEISADRSWDGQPEDH